MPERTGYPDGAPCWPELTTSDLALATRFYQKVFGWSYRDLGSQVWGYKICLAGGKPVAALAPPPVGLESGPSAWMTYFSTSDLEASVVRAEANDGKLIILPTLLRGFARIAVAVDPEGAPFGLWQAAGQPGCRLHSEPGAMCWSELHARNPKLVDPFYRALFGYEAKQVGDGVEFDYVLWKIRHKAVCGRVRMPYELEDLSPQWVTYLIVPDCEQSIDLVVREGGRVLIGEYELRGTRVAVVSDPQGAIFAVCQHTPAPHLTSPPPTQNL
ncbi:VOC family protein [Sphaerisporangium corydalis]|uniref:VOC family protein n=1 Tax=Sphaerisporangium corydalis TaxID=1441875 RepID=A0ABV9E9G5_9ACTN|nr:VOC family protein [Sphaerisporangium corydalis]